MILTITGSDSTGGSGVQADIRTISELGGYAVSAITSITVQNTLGIQEFFDIPAEIVSGQIEAIMNDVQPDIAGPQKDLCRSNAGKDHCSITAGRSEQSSDASG